MTPPPTSATPQTPPLYLSKPSSLNATARKSAYSTRFWLGVAASYTVSVTTARRIAAKGSIGKHPRGGVRTACIKTTVEVMSKLEEYLDEQADMTMAVMKDRLLSDLSVDVSITSIHRALHNMLYTVKGLRIEKAAMNNAVNKEKRMAFAKAFNAHVAAGDMIVYHNETNFNIYLSHNQGWARVGERAVVTLPASKGKNLHVQCGVSPGNGLVLLCTHDGPVHMEENARFVADLFVAALNNDEYKKCCVG